MHLGLLGGGPMTGRAGAACCAGGGTANGGGGGGGTSRCTVGCPAELPGVPADADRAGGLRGKRMRDIHRPVSACEVTAHAYLLKPAQTTEDQHAVCTVLAGQALLALWGHQYVHAVLAWLHGMFLAYWAHAYCIPSTPC